MLKALQITPHLSSKLPDTTSWLKSEENEAGEVEQAAEVTERACGRRESPRQVVCCWPASPLSGERRSP